MNLLKVLLGYPDSPTRLQKLSVSVTALLLVAGLGGFAWVSAAIVHDGRAYEAQLHQASALQSYPLDFYSQKGMEFHAVRGVTSSEQFKAILRENYFDCWITRCYVTKPATPKAPDPSGKPSFDPVKYLLDKSSGDMGGQVGLTKVEMDFNKWGDSDFIQNPSNMFLLSFLWFAPYILWRLISLWAGWVMRKEAK